MENTSTFSVVVSGQLKEGFDPAKIQSALAAILKVSPEKAAALMRRQWVIKKDVDQQTATKYKNKLESIGLIIGLKENFPSPPKTGGLSLALEPTEEEQTVQQAAEKTAVNPGIVTCPKCGTEQPAATEQCTGCGVFLRKVLARVGAVNVTPQAQSQDQTQEEEESSIVITEENLTVKSIAVGAAAALLGAIVWNIIGNVFDYELGIVAWGIGGAIGFAVAATGGRGNQAAMVCAAFALLAILGGKYMLYASFKDDVSELISQNMEGMQSLYDEQVRVADAFADVTDDESLRQFMVEYQYSEAGDPDAITNEEITFFKSDIEPALSAFASNRTSYDEWVKETFTQQMGQVSTIDLIKQNFGVLDILFLFLGVGTAFRLGRGTE